MPSSPPRPPTNELGHVAAWTDFSGWPVDIGEETPELFWPNSVRVYDRMRRTDAQVRGTYWALTLPLRRDIWALNPGRARDEVVAQTAEDLDLPIVGVDREPPMRRQGRFSWAEHLRLALLDLIYGHMPFEQVYEVVDGKARLRKLGPRFPQTLAGINVAPDGGLISIEQYPLRGMDKVVIPVSRLAYYVNDREGGSWQGQSILRACYKHWLLKDRGLRTWAMSLERTGMGVPVIEAPERATPAQLKELHKMAQNYRAGENAGGALPYGAKLSLIGVTGNVPNAGDAIGYHDNAIARAMLTQFLQLGTDGNAGNRALVSGFMDFFALATDGIAGRIASTTTAHVVEDYVDINWGPEEPAPFVEARSIDAEVDIPLEALVQLIEVGAVTMDDELEDWLRAKGKLPKRGVGAPRPVVTPAVPATARHGRRMRAARHPHRASTARRNPQPVSAAKPSRRRYLSALTEYFAPAIADVLEGCADPRAIVTRYRASQAAVRASRTSAREAVEAEGVDVDDLEEVVTAAYGDAYLAGGHLALATLPVSNPLAPPWEHQVDWSDWVPGASAVAVALAMADNGRSLAALVDTVADVVDGIASTTTDRLVDALVAGDDDGDTQARLIQRLSNTLGDGSRATTIAMTEASRAMGGATVDAYRDNGIVGREWVALDDPCPDCEAMNGIIVALDDPFPDLGDVPAHPNCRCSTLPVTAEEMAA